MTCTCRGRNGYSDVCTVHGVAARFPAQVQADGRAWYRPVRDAGMDLSQWGWTSDPRQAHPAYRALYDAQTGGLHPEGLCGGDCSGCVGEGEGGPHVVEHAPTGQRARCGGPGACSLCTLRVETAAVVVGNDVERIPQAADLLTLLDESTGLW
ncbi:hypothetical protein I5H01_gp024 [Mycobacterium phage MarkPhew]|uniref:Uncharacterized protein n=1 Tax=Mycobacterium phage MarkPhew TaxID=2725625 RepID=A0A6M3SWM4_9CAUD|nr:hypothetical protein I5H01_gp024 [Mycobacterium phage MarkPhew]QJD50383.1 hypothetical protein SEA_MARKPHEW_83 [Mycobacterium phage MarkPhew]